MRIVRNRTATGVLGVRQMVRMCNYCTMQQIPAAAEHPPDVGPVVDAVLTASRVLVAIAARSLAESSEEVTFAQYRALVVLAAHGPRRVSELAENLGVNRSTATRLCDRLVRKGLVRRRASSHDRREVLLALTEAGWDLIDQATRRRRDEIAAVLASVPAGDQADLVRSLTLFAQAAGEVPDQSWAAGWEL